MAGLLFLLIYPFHPVKDFWKISQAGNQEQTDFFGCWCCHDHTV